MQTDSYKTDPHVAEAFARLLADPGIQKALAYIKADHANMVEEQKEMALIPGAPYTELEIRSPMYREKLEQYGLADCFTDEVGNVFGYVHGSGAGPKILMEAHLDTVFPLETPLKIEMKGSRIYCPGIGDDTAAMASLLCVIRAIRHAGLKPCGTLMIGGTVGEESPGDARGVIHLMETQKDLDAYIAVETCWTHRVTRGAVACVRYEVIFTGPGGHSWNAFGLPSPLHAAGRAVAAIAELQPPKAPKTTFNVGIINGGTTVNSIASETRMRVDVRSVSTRERDNLAKTIADIIHDAVKEENCARPMPEGSDSAGIAVTIRTYNVKPGGDQPINAPIVQIAAEATRAVGVEPQFLPPSSTNANFPIDAGMPALCIGAGGNAGNSHAPDEWFDPTGGYDGPQKCLLMLYAAAGLQGVTEPLMPKWKQ